MSSDGTAFSASMHADSSVAQVARELFVRWNMLDVPDRFNIGVTNTLSDAGHLCIPVTDNHGAILYIVYRALAPVGTCGVCHQTVEAYTMVEQHSVGGDWSRCPHCDADGDNANLGWLITQHPRFVMPPHTSRILYHANGAFAQAHQQGYCYLVEGHRDVWAMETAGIPAIGISGAYMSQLQLDLLTTNLSTSVTIVIGADGDITGHKTARTHQEQLKALGYKTRIHSNWYGTKDPAAMLERHGQDALAAVAQPKQQ